jgi:DNA polymerase IV
LHVDLDAFYASVEQRDDPTLRGKPVIVGGHSSRGVVCAASYEARRFGIKSAMPMARALAQCPDAVVLRPRMDHYANVSRDFFTILESYTPLVEGLSLDEAFLDVSAVRTLWGDGPTIAGLIKDRVRKDLSLVASVGVAPIKFAAKIASDLRKPDGLVVVHAGELLAFLSPLPVSRLWGVGEVTEAALSTLGVRTIGDVARTPRGFLEARVGRSLGQHLHELAEGIDTREVVPERAAVSIGHEDTFEEDIFDRERLRWHLLDQADRVAARLRAKSMRARVLTLKIKYADHRRISRQKKLHRPTHDGQVLGAAAAELLAKVPSIEKLGVRLTGISLSDFESTDTANKAPPIFGQMSLDLLAPPPPPAVVRGDRLGKTLDTIRSRFGGESIRRAVTLDESIDGGAFPHYEGGSRDAEVVSKRAPPKRRTK